MHYPLKRARSLFPLMCAPPRIHLCLLGLLYVPWELIYGPWGSFMPPGTQVCTPHMCARHRAMLFPLGLLYVTWRLIYAPCGSFMSPRAQVHAPF
jgi:hypothetical protein